MLCGVAGVELYLWRKNVFVNVVGEDVRLWVRVREVDVGLEPLPHCGRIDVHVASPSLKQDAHWVRLITTEINWVRMWLMSSVSCVVMCRVTCDVCPVL